MAPWGWVGVGYAAFMALVAISGGTRRRSAALGACTAFAVLSAGAAMLRPLWAQIVCPGALALAGYWLSGLFIGTPQPWLESWLLASDRHVFQRLRIDPILRATPSWILNLIEASYSTVYFVVMAGALLVIPAGGNALRQYWLVVLPAEFVCCAALPFLRCRPPRALETPGVIALRNPLMRRVNTAIVNRGSIQVNTLPSAHVSAALASGLAVMSSWPAAGLAVVACAAAIAAAAVLGRYHYAVDCALGAMVATALWWML